MFSLLKTRLDCSEKVQSLISTSASARVLLQLCIESAQHIVAVLERLKEQNLLGTATSFYCLERITDLM